MEKTIKALLRSVLPISLLAVSVISCDSDEPSVKRDCVSRSIEITQSEREVSERSNAFAWELLQKCIEEDNKGGSVVISPLSANICLSMLANGASGESRQQILQALGFNEKDMNDVNSLNSKLARQICGIDDNITIYLANSFWYNPAIQPKTTFLNDLKSNYSVKSYSIKPSTFVSDVNRWGKEQTKGLITRVLDEDVHADCAFLNAIYFQGFWSHDYRFNKSATREDYFHNSDGSKSAVSFMRKSMRYAYHQEDKWRALRIPFSGGGFCLTIVLPYEDYSIEECMSSLKGFEFGTTRFSSEWLDLRLPKISIKNNQGLIEVFKKMGIIDIFDSSLSDFSNMSDCSMVIDLAKQNVSFEMDEDGAEAAAVTDMDGLISADLSAKEGTFYVDHPFIFMISEKSTGAILFIGRINKL